MLQNDATRTLVAPWSLRATAWPTVSTPVTWEEIEQGIRIDDFRIDNVRERVREVGDLWKPVAVGKKRFDLRKVFTPKPKKSERRMRMQNEENGE